MVVADEVDVCFKVEILYSMSVIYSSSKIAARYCSDSRGSRFKFTAGDSSDGEMTGFMLLPILFIFSYS